ncbi:HD domain-containing protein [Psychrobacter sp. TAE2020]|uniref:HD domain-containing protein n=1 Tax=Psychrobacter sp. TAE2020 TaxID=2846762 RepID=UPI001C1256C3|nr:HD domain-containing protein [Psychrobacter sp. TAE2020]MBU5615549.1 HD domain-containing protein [Psychrobacter sp. TAE2020]
MPSDLTAITEYLLELDALKLINRRTYIDGGLRVENSAEHSWHLAMACWSISRSFKLEVSEEKLLKLALIHDLGEIDAGDTFLYDTNRSIAHNAEREGVKRLQSHLGNGVGDLCELWEEQETGDSLETKLLKVVDRLLPFLHNINSEGKTWREQGVKKSQVLQAHAFIAEDFPEIHSWMFANINSAVQAGWLLDDELV